MKRPQQSSTLLFNDWLLGSVMLCALHYPSSCVCSSQLVPYVPSRDTRYRLVRLSSIL